MLAGVLASLLSTEPARTAPILSPRTWRLACSGIGTIGAPALLLLMGRQRFSSVMAVATQASLPVIVAVVAGALDPEIELQRRLMPALLALAGTLLVLPVALPHSSQGWIGFSLYFAAAGLSGISTVFCHRDSVRHSAGAALLIVAGANAIFVGGAAAIWLVATDQGHLLRGAATMSSLLPIVLVSGDILALAALLRLLPPLAVASRLVFVPLIAALEAYILLRPTLSLRTAVGSLLMLVGGLACVHAEDSPDASAKMSLP